jgi:hypothetical protein
LVRNGRREFLLKAAAANADNRRSMDLVNAMSGLQQAKVMGEVQVAVAKKVMDSQRMEGAAAIKLLQAASNGVNKAGDQLVAAATGLGGSLDTYG